MSRLTARTAALASMLAIAASVFPHTALAGTRHASGFAGREAGVGIGVGHALPVTRTPSTMRLSIPPPSAIRDRQPAAKPARDPFPDFSVPLRRHRMAMPDSAIPALGDLSF